MTRRHWEYHEFETPRPNMKTSKDARSDFKIISITWSDRKNVKNKSDNISARRDRKLIWWLSQPWSEE